MSQVIIHIINELKEVESLTFAFKTELSLIIVDEIINPGSIGLIKKKNLTGKAFQHLNNIDHDMQYLKRVLCLNSHGI